MEIQHFCNHNLVKILLFLVFVVVVIGLLSACIPACLCIAFYFVITNCYDRGNNLIIALFFLS